ncbi:MAG: amidohydrolase family protein [Actinomycetota bacterium]
MPGFIDAHVHIGFFNPKRVLAGGVTTARDLGWPLMEIFTLARELIADPDAGPQLLCAGPMITAVGGYPTQARWAPPGTGLEVSGAPAAVDAVAMIASMGACIIKVAQAPQSGPTLDPAELGAVVETAHGLGLRVTSHCSSVAQLHIALEAGVDELAHGLWSDEPLSDDLVNAIAGSMTIVPTLHIDPSEVRLANTRRLFEAGAPFVYGTDMGNSGPPAGIDVDELRLMMQIGMSAHDVIASATSSAAIHLGLHDVGLIEPGATANFIIVDGDPSVDISNLAAPMLVHRAK